MAGSLKTGFSISGFNGALNSSRRERISGSCAPVGSLRFKEPTSRDASSLSSDFMGKQIMMSDRKDSDWRIKAAGSFSVHASICVSPAMRWWDKTLKPNMVEINSAMELVTSLRSAGDKLVVVDFYSPGCGGCRTLHPKICQLAELHLDAVFLKVNYDELRPMCKCLNVHVLPFFKFYRGSEGRVCSFSCTNATIKKFKDAVAKHGSNRCSIGPAKGLDDSELQRLVSSGELSKDWSLPSQEDNSMDDLLLAGMGMPGARNRAIEMVSFEEVSVVSDSLPRS